MQMQNGTSLAYLTPSLTDVTKSQAEKGELRHLSFILYIWLFKIFPDWRRVDTADVSTGDRGTDWRGKNNHSVFSCPPIFSLR